MESSDTAVVQVNDDDDDKRQTTNKNDRYSHIDFTKIEHILDFSKPYTKYGAISSTNPTPDFSLSALQTTQTLTVQPPTKLCDLDTTNTSDDESECGDDGHDKPYQCDTCKRRFVRATHMRRHKRIHTGERPYSCHICRMRFSRSDYVDNHIYRHQRDKVHHCIVCDEAFYDLINFTIHCHKSHNESEYFEASSKQKANKVCHKAKSPIVSSTSTTPAETAPVLEDDSEKDIVIIENISTPTNNNNNCWLVPVIVNTSFDNLWQLQFPSGSMLPDQQFYTISIPPTTTNHL